MFEESCKELIVLCNSLQTFSEITQTLSMTP